jgi:hypothetical protein
MSQNCGRKFDNGTCTPKFEPRGAVDTKKDYLQLKNAGWRRILEFFVDLLTPDVRPK